ncbi:MAG: RtcB family protein, partial [bacterium]
MSAPDFTLKKAGNNHYVLPGHDEMKQDVHLYLNETLVDQLEYDSLRQLKNASTLPGVEYIACMPDVHVGYGVPVGGVMAMNAETGLVSAGAVGMDINCGMRLLMSNISARECSDDDIKSLARKITRRIPLGIGTKSHHADTLEPHINKILRNGVPELVELGFAKPEDCERIQDGGSYPGADTSGITDDAWGRLDQLSTLGGGNHFIEIVRVNEIFDPEHAEAFGLSPDQLGVMIHTGSRGLGHQLCVDYSDTMLELAPKHDLSFPDDALAAAPIQSDIGQDYLGAMGCAANFAYCNRQVMTHDIRKIFQEQFPKRGSKNNVNIIYDITHNLARFETVNEKDVLVHRKGAVRTLPPGHPDNPPAYDDTGHPVIIPGHMGIGSYVLSAGTNIEETYYSV